jgi:DNA-binding transcriptional regulator YdaS (Cro superfamily)
MDKKEFTASEVRAMLRQRSCELGSQRALARAMGVSDPFLSDVLRGGRAISAVVLSYLGMTQVETTYKALDGDSELR